MVLPIVMISVVGFCITLYAYLLEQKLKQDPSFKPACDISDRFSCTKPMKSPYADIFFVSNTVLGLIFYAVIAIFALLNAPILLFITAMTGFLISCYLGYLLFFKVKSFCPLCISLYIINLLILILSIGLFNH